MLSQDAQNAKALLLRHKWVVQLIDRVAHLERPTDPMVAAAYQMTDVARGDLLSLALREFPVDEVAQRALEPLGLVDNCGNITVDGSDLAGALLRWRFYLGPRSPWVLDGHARRQCRDCGVVFDSPHQVGRCLRCVGG